MSLPSQFLDFTIRLFCEGAEQAVTAVLTVAEKVLPNSERFLRTLVESRAMLRQLNATGEMLRQMRKDRTTPHPTHLAPYATTFVETVLSLALPKRRREEIIGDLLEKHSEEVRSIVWLIGQAFYLIGAAAWLRAVDAVKRLKGRPPNS